MLGTLQRQHRQHHHSPGRKCSTREWRRLRTLTMALPPSPLIFVICGPSGCGKTTVGQLLAERFGCQFLDADDYHSPASIRKMRSGVPLSDDDRWPWLTQLAGLLRQHIREGTRAVLACSALKQAYRQLLASAACGTELEPQPAAAPRSSNSAIVFVMLSPGEEVLQTRLGQRSGHFMPASLLQSQLATLEADGCHLCFGSEAAVTIVDSIVAQTTAAG